MKVTNQKIRDYFQSKYGIKPTSNWIAHAKEVYGVPVRRAANRKGEERLWKCPKRHLVELKEVFEHFGLLKD